MKYLKFTIIFLIFAFAVYTRIPLFGQAGKDVDAYKRAVTDLIEGKNPYKWTIESFSNPDDPGNHGFAYLPGFIYINFVLLMISYLTKIPFEFLQKIPVLMADIGVGILIVKNLYKKNYLACIFGLIVWFFNPYFVLKRNYVYVDPLPVFFMLLALELLEKDEVLSGTYYALSVALKTFPLLLLPIFLLKSKDRAKFFIASAIIGIAISLPFLGDPVTYLTGALLIHGGRFIQGRPFLFYISYFYKIEFFQIIPFRVYTFLASFSGWVASSLLHFYKLILDKYILSTISFIFFYIFTPILNRTYLLWFLPVFIIGTYNFAEKRNKFIYYVVLAGFYGFYYWYLLQWKDGFHIWRP